MIGIEKIIFILSLVRKMTEKEINDGSLNSYWLIQDVLRHKVQKENKFYF